MYKYNVQTCTYTDVHVSTLDLCLYFMCTCTLYILFTIPKHTYMYMYTIIIHVLSVPTCIFLPWEYMYMQIKLYGSLDVMYIQLNMYMYIHVHTVDIDIYMYIHIYKYTCTSTGSAISLTTQRISKRDKIGSVRSTYQIKRITIKYNNY